MKSLGFAILFFCNSAFALTEGYDLKLSLSLNGQHLSSQRVLVKTGETASISQKTESEETSIQVTAKEGSLQNKEGILMEFSVKVLSDNGQKTVVTRPTLLAKENEPAIITIGEKDNKVSLSVVAKRRTF